MNAFQKEKEAAASDEGKYSTSHLEHNVSFPSTRDARREADPTCPAFSRLARWPCTATSLLMSAVTLSLSLTRWRSVGFAGRCVTRARLQTFSRSPSAAD